MLGISPKPKIKVEIIHENGDSTFKKCELEENKVIIQKRRRGRGGVEWAPTFNRGCIVEPKKRFLCFWTRKQPKRLTVLEGAQNCIDFQANPDPELNGLKFRDLEKLTDLEVIKRSGEVKIKHELPLVFWVLVLVGGLNLVFQFLQMRGMRLV